MPVSHRVAAHYAGESALRDFRITTHDGKPGLRLYRGMREDHVIPEVGIVASGANAEPKLLAPNPVEKFVRAVHEGDDTVRDAMIGRHVRSYTHNAARQERDSQYFASPFLSASPYEHEAAHFAQGNGERVLTMHVPLDRLVVDPTYHIGRPGEVVAPRDILVLGGVAAHEIISYGE